VAHQRAQGGAQSAGGGYFARPVARSVSGRSSLKSDSSSATDGALSRSDLLQDRVGAPYCKMPLTCDLRVGAHGFRLRHRAPIAVSSERL
jgi:hypothetical protein